MNSSALRTLGGLATLILIACSPAEEPAELGIYQPKLESDNPTSVSEDEVLSGGGRPSNCVDVKSSTGDLVGFRLRELAEVVNDPRAGMLTYAYLEHNRDALVLHAPAIPGLDFAALDLPAAKIIDLPPYQAFEVFIPGSGGVRYTIQSQDFEDEVDLRQVTLCEIAGNLTASLILAGTGAGGVAHSLVIQAAHNGKLIGSSAAVSVEVRQH